MDLDSSIVESSQSIIPHSLQYGLRSTDENPQIGDEVEIFIRHTGKGRIRRSVTKPGYVVEIDSRDPTRVKTHNCLHKFHKVIENCTRHSTSMISNDTQSQSDHSISQYY